MLFSLGLFIISWICFIVFADKKLFSRILSTCYLAMIFGLVTDLLMPLYHLWDYPASNRFGALIRNYSDDFGVYFVVTYLFIQTLPRKQTIFNVAVHIFSWSALTIGIELFASATKSIKYGLWWNIGFSYISDWILFIIFYFHYKLVNKTQST